MPSEHRRGFRVLFFCLLSVGIGQAMLFAILPPAARKIGISPFKVSTIFAVSASIWVFVSPWWGRRSDVIGRRSVILIGLLGFALSMVLLATVIKIGLLALLPAMAVYPLLVASRSVFALLGSGTGPASQAYVADRTSRFERSAGVALVSAGLGAGQAVGPGLGAALAVLGLLVPIYFSAALAVASAVVIWLYLPEDGPPVAEDSLPPRMSARDARVVPFVVVAASLQAVRATTVITLAFFLQDTLGLTAQQTVQYAGIGFVVLAVAGLFSQLFLVQRFKPSPAFMMRAGVPLIVAACALLAARVGFRSDLVALLSLGLGLGLVRPGSAAGASLAVEANEQGAVAGLMSGIAVVGNIIGPLLGTALYEVTPPGPYVLNGALMAAIMVFIYSNRRLRHAR